MTPALNPAPFLVLLHTQFKQVKWAVLAIVGSFGILSILRLVIGVAICIEEVAMEKPFVHSVYIIGAFFSCFSGGGSGKGVLGWLGGRSLVPAVQEAWG